MYHLLLVVFLGIPGLLPATLVAQGPAPFSEQVEALRKKYDTLWQENRETLVFTGSSSIRMWKLRHSDRGRQLINTGFGGSRVSDLAIHAEPLILHFKPTVVVIYEGDNDLAEGRSAGRVYRQMRHLVQQLHLAKPDLHIFLMAAKPSPQRWKLRRAFRKYNRKLLRYSQETDYLDFLDTWTPLLSPSGKLRPELYRSDGLHLNEEGYKVWTRIMQRNNLL